MLSSIARMAGTNSAATPHDALWRCISPASFWPTQHIVESAWLEHGPFAFWLTDAIRPRILVELGTHNGFSYLSFCQAVAQLGLPTACYAVDTWLGDEHAGFYGEEVYARLAAVNDEHYAAFSRLLRCRFHEALPHFRDGSVDLLHVDGRHTYEDAKEDFESWRPKLSTSAVVLFHDTNVRERDFGVWRLWAELSETYPAFEFLHGHGLGVLAFGPDIPAALRPLVEAGPDQAAAIRAAYTRLGHSVSRQYQLGLVHASLGQSIAEQERLRAEHQAAVQASLAEQERLRVEHEAAMRASLAEQERLRAEHQAAVQASLAEHEAALHAALAEQGRLRAEHQAAVQVASAELARVQAEKDRDGQALRRAEATLARTHGEVQELGKANADLRALLDEQRQALDTLRGECDERGRAVTNLQAALMQQAEREQSCRTQLRQIEQSTLWRVGNPLRSALSGAPKPLRTTLRRVAKAMWWSVTPHRMPERIAFLRTRQRGSASHPAVLTVQSVAAALLKPISPSGAQRLSPQFLAFLPSPRPGNAKLPASRDGRYALVDSHEGYVYVPPRRPDGLDHVLAALPHRVRFSIIVPTYNTALDLLDRMLASVLTQWYPHWQLVIADDASPRPEVREFLAQIDDPRVEIVLLERNGGISAATNAALARATGDYVVFLDHDDELTEDCLYELALCIGREDPDFVYSDEDKIDQDGRFTQPFFKPDWSPDTLMSTMYTCHVSCVRRSLLEQVGPLRSEYDGVQDWDLTLRITEQTARIAHVPKVLYHWRIIPASIAADLSAKPYAIDAGRRVREAALTRRGRPGVLEAVEQVPGYFRVRYIPEGMPLVSVVIPTRDNGPVLRRCIDSLRTAGAWRNLEIVVIDNGSENADTVGYLQKLRDSGDAKIVRHTAPFNYSELNNLGAREARGELLLFLNDDTELLSVDALERMVGYAQLPHVGAVGAKLLYPGTLTVQHVGVVNLASGPGHAFLRQPADAPGYFMRNLLEFDWAAVTGACLMLERSKFEAIGGFDEEFPVAYNDVDLCFRLLRRGLYNLVCPSARWLHHESLTRGDDLATPERRARLTADKRRLHLRHPDMLMRDPFHSPNLHPNSVQFDLPA